MALDLSFLETPEQAVSSGLPLMLTPDLISEDPDQPRHDFEPVALGELTEDIKKRGILQPIVVRPPNVDGIYFILYGARRYRAGVAAGLAVLPVIVASDERHFDAYSQVAENTQRAELTPKELALFIERRLKLNESKADIARGLGVKAPVVTWHVALIDPPAFLDELYTSGKSRSAEYLYRLRVLHNKAPEIVEKRVAAATTISRVFVDQLADEVDPKRQNPPPVADEGRGSGSVADPLAKELANAEREAAQLTPDAGAKPPPKNGAGGNVDPEEFAKVRYRSIIVIHDERPAQLVLTRRASAVGLGWIKYADDGNEVEIELGQAKLDSLVE
jgi:ParB family chromosome partitioning protein